ncbi:MAG TPA: hypothetical protein VH951_08905, partial [Dehalococcoidia bacterium]
PTHVAYHWKSGACPGTTTAVWDGVRTALSGDVAPAATVTNLSMSVTAPVATGTYCLVVDLVREGLTWFATQGSPTLNLAVTVN